MIAVVTFVIILPDDHFFQYCSHCRFRYMLHFFQKDMPTETQVLIDATVVALVLYEIGIL